MPWLKSEGRTPRNDKLWELSDAAYRLYDAGRHYAVENLTDGHVPLSRISALTPKPATKVVIREVLRAKLWHELPDICERCLEQRTKRGVAPLPKTGYVVHDFLVYNPSKAEYEEEQERKRSLAVIGGQARAASAPRTGGRFASRAAGQEPAVSPAVPLVKTASGTSGDTSRTAGLAGDEKAPAAPAVRPAVAPAPYPVSRTPVPKSVSSLVPNGNDELERSGTGSVDPGVRAEATDARPPRHIAETVRTVARGAGAG